MKKLFISLLTLLFLSVQVQAKIKNKDLTTIITDSGIPESSVAVSVKDINKGNAVYSLNENILMHPASVQKLLTILPVVKTLGEDYKLKTSIYKRDNSTYVIKLGADPYLTTEDLKSLVSKINTNTVKKILIDDSIIETKDWGEGWQWDDDMNISMPHFNSYNLDKNIYTITVMPTEAGKQAKIINPGKVPTAFYNNVLTGNKNEITITRDNINFPNILKLEGTVSSSVSKVIPNNNPKRYFIAKLTNILEDNKIYLKEPYSSTRILNSDKLLAEISHPIDSAVNDILKNSNNMAIETTAKIAASKQYNKQGCDTDAVNLITEYFNNQELDISRIRIVDSSGVSKNNLMSADFITEFLLKNKDNKLFEHMAYPTTGTLSNRMIPLKDNLKAKTGTLSDISSIAGFLTSKSGNCYAFCIIINDPASGNSAKKNLEDYLIRELYLKL